MTDATDKVACGDDLERMLRFGNACRSLTNPRSPICIWSKSFCRRSGILRWMIDGAVDWYSHGLFLPNAVS